MSGFLSDTLQAIASERRVNAAVLVQMNFKSGTDRVWMGAGILDAGGHEWQGLGDLVSIEGLDSVGEISSQATFTMSGVSQEMVVRARNFRNEGKNRRILVFLQFFTIASTQDREAWAPIDDPISVWSGRMDQVRFTASLGVRTLVLTAENLWSARNQPPFSFLTDTDQRFRFPNDRGLEHIPSLINKTIRWPDL